MFTLAQLLMLGSWWAFFGRPELDPDLRPVLDVGPWTMFLMLTVLLSVFIGAVVTRDGIQGLKRVIVWTLYALLSLSGVSVFL